MSPLFIASPQTRKECDKIRRQSEESEKHGLLIPPDLRRVIAQKAAYIAVYGILNMITSIEYTGSQGFRK